MIALEGVTHRFGNGPPVIEDLSLSIARGELVALIGPSGCGKSTLLNLIAGLLRPSGGRVVRTEEPRIGYVFQSPRLLPWRRVLGNVEFALEQRGEARREASRERARRALTLVDLEGHEDKYPRELSGGMAQRVALARGLAIDPAVLLLDEPFASLDALTRGYLQEELLGIVRGSGATALLVTHDIDEALLMAGRVVVMSSRPGRIKAEVDVPFGDERSMDRVVADPHYPEIRTRLHRLLRPEVAGDPT